MSTPQQDYAETPHASEAPRETARDRIQRRGRRLVGAFTVTMFALFLGVVAVQGADADGLHVAVRVTGAFSFMLFYLAYVASALDRATSVQWTQTLHAHRRYLGVSFGLCHLIHALGLVWLASVSMERFDALGPFLIALLLLGYAFVIAMLLTSNDRAREWMGLTHWRRLHWTGLNYVWLLFLAEYLRLARDLPIYGIHIALLLGGLGLRIAVNRARRRA